MRGDTVIAKVPDFTVDPKGRLVCKDIVLTVFNEYFKWDKPVIKP